jgi:hypothetical protein
VSPAGCTWQDVVESMESATRAHTSKENSNILRSVPRNHALVTTLLGLTEMIPEQYGLSVLRGGLSLVFKVMPFRCTSRLP